MLYNVVLISAIRQHEWVIGIHILPPSWASLPFPIPFHPSSLFRLSFLSFCFSALECQFQKSKVLVAQSSLILCDPMDCSPQALLSMKFSRQGYWSGLPFPSPGDLPNPGIKPRSAALQADSLPTELQGKTRRARMLLFLFSSLFAEPTTVTST